MTKLRAEHLYYYSYFSPTLHKSTIRTLTHRIQKEIEYLNTPNDIYTKFIKVRKL